MVDSAKIQNRPALASLPIRVPAVPRTTRIALAHDWLIATRGGEQVLDAIATLIDRNHDITTLYTLCASNVPITRRIDKLDAVVSPLQRLGAAGPLRRWMLPLYPSAVASLSRKLARNHRANPIDLLISTSSCAIKGMRSPEGVPHLCYCHAPARYLWNHRRESAQGSILRSLALALYGPHFRAWDRANSRRINSILANSSHTAKMIRSAYGLEANVVHPPVRTAFFTPDPSTPREDFFLIVSALEPYKRVDLAIEAVRASGEPLVVVGSGSIESRVKASAPNNVTFAGWLNDPEVRDLYRRARALLFPQVEDFGIVAVEAQACGCPVVARKSGGALDTVLEDQTGVFFSDPTPRALADAMARSPRNADQACRTNAQRFSAEIFESKMGREIDALLAHAAEASPDGH